MLSILCQGFPYLSKLFRRFSGNFGAVSALVSRVWCLVSGACCLVSGVWCLVSGGSGSRSGSGSGSYDWPSARVARCRSDVSFFYIRHRGWFFWVRVLGPGATL